MHIIRYLGVVLAPSSKCSILIQMPLPAKPARKMIWA